MPMRVVIAGTATYFSELGSYQTGQPRGQFHVPDGAICQIFGILKEGVLPPTTVNARFLLFSVRCVAASVIAKFDNARFSNSGKVTCHCECWVCQCWIFDIFNMFCC